MTKKRFIMLMLSMLFIFSLIPIFNSAGEDNIPPVVFFQDEAKDNKTEISYKNKKIKTERPRAIKVELEYSIEDIEYDSTKECVSLQTAIDILGEEEYYILAKLLYAEAGSMSWEGQVHTCSAILNLRDYSGRTIWNMAHDINTMAVAPYVDYECPMDTQYDVIEYVVCGGGRIEEICYFRTSYYHSFGTPVCSIENVYFSKP